MPNDAPRHLAAPLVDRSVFLMQSLGDMQVLGRVGFAGRLDAGRLGRALELLVQTEPVLGCRFDLAGWRPRWTRRTDPMAAARLEVIDATDPRAAVADFFARPRDPTRDPLLATCLVRGPEGDTLALVLSHLVADGGAVKSALYRVAAAYRALEADPAYVPPSPAGRRDLVPILRGVGLRGVLRMLARMGKDAGRNLVPLATWRVPYIAPTGRPWTLAERELDAAEVARLRETASRLKATLNDVLVAAYVRALVTLCRPAPDLPLRLQTTVDLRRYLVPGADPPLANLSGPAFLRLVGGPGATLAETVSKVRADMLALKADALGLGQFPLGAALLGLFPFRFARWLIPRLLRSRLQAALSPPSFTNTGALDPARLDVGGPAVLRASLHAPAFRPPFLLVSASSFVDTLTLSVGHAPASLPPGGAAALLDAIADEVAGGSTLR